VFAVLREPRALSSVTAAVERPRDSGGSIHAHCCGRVCPWGKAVTIRPGFLKGSRTGSRRSEVVLTGSTPGLLSRSAQGRFACFSETVRVGPYSTSEQTGSAFHVAAVG
jgi:hypothetical protein